MRRRANPGRDVSPEETPRDARTLATGDPRVATPDIVAEIFAASMARRCARRAPCEAACSSERFTGVWWNTSPFLRGWTARRASCCAVPAKKRALIGPPPGTPIPRFTTQENPQVRKNHLRSRRKVKKSVRRCGFSRVAASRDAIDPPALTSPSVTRSPTVRSEPSPVRASSPRRGCERANVRHTARLRTADPGDPRAVQESPHGANQRTYLRSGAHRTRDNAPTPPPHAVAISPPSFIIVPGTLGGGPRPPPAAPGSSPGIRRRCASARARRRARSRARVRARRLRLRPPSRRRRARPGRSSERSPRGASILPSPLASRSSPPPPRGTPTASAPPPDRVSARSWPDAVPREG